MKKQLLLVSGCFVLSACSMNEFTTAASDFVKGLTPSNLFQGDVLGELEKDLDGDGVKDKVYAKPVDDSGTLARLYYQLSTEDFKEHKTQKNGFLLQVPYDLSITATEQGFDVSTEFSGQTYISNDLMSFEFDKASKKMRMTAIKTQNQHSSGQLDITNGKYTIAGWSTKTDTKKKKKGRKKSLILPPIYFEQIDRELYDKLCADFFKKNGLEM